MSGGVSGVQGGCLVWGGSGVRGGLVSGVSGGVRGGREDVCSRGGGRSSVRGGGGVSQHALRQNPPPPVNRMTNRCKNITLATTSLRPVNIFESAGHQYKTR